MTWNEPDPADEGLHHRGQEPLWGESWYSDAVSADGSLGVYVRLGRVPNLDHCLYTASIVRPGKPAIMVVDAAAPLPSAADDRQPISTDAFTAAQNCVEPLQCFQVSLDGEGASYDDHSAPLRGEAGEPVAVAIDLSWHTDGTGYQWDITSRYEIPCRVTGTVTIDGEIIAFEGPGQRDHSWGVRDWWAFDWVWSAFHLDDGTHTHAFLSPIMPGMAVGYTQRAGERSEITTGEVSYEVGADGLPTTTTLTSGPDGLSLSVEPVAYGAIRLVSPDGAVSHFPRAMAKVTAADGRAGWGWLEWNLNQVK